ncbi:MAG TPA: hypothetical protein VF382_08350 [Actinomycetota bacterium]
MRKALAIVLVLAFGLAAAFACLQVVRRRQEEAAFEAEVRELAAA